MQAVLRSGFRSIPKHQWESRGTSDPLPPTSTSEISPEMCLLHVDPRTVCTIPASGSEPESRPRDASPTPPRSRPDAASVPARELDHVARPDERKRSSGGRFGDAMQHDVRRPCRSSCVGNAHHIRDALRRILGGNAYCRLPPCRIAHRSAVLEYHDAVFVDVEILVRDALVEVFDVFDTTARPRCCKSAATRRRV